MRCLCPVPQSAVSLSMFCLGNWVPDASLANQGWGWRWAIQYPPLRCCQPFLVLFYQLAPLQAHP